MYMINAKIMIKVKIMIIINMRIMRILIMRIKHHKDKQIDIVL